MNRFISAALVWSLAAGAAAQAPTINGKTLVLEPGQSAIVTIGRDGPSMATDSVLAETNGRPSGNAAGFKFTTDSVTSTNLEIRNGYDQALDVDAVMYAPDGRHKRTSICIVIPHGTGVETWPHAIARIEITKFKLIDFKGGGFMRCD